MNEWLKKFAYKLVSVWYSYVTQVMSMYYQKHPLDLSYIPIECMYKDVPVIVNDSLAKVCTGMYVDELVICMSYLTQIDGEIIPIIIMSKRFNMLPSSVIEFFVEHEIGHIKQGDKVTDLTAKKQDRTNSALIGTAIPEELGADAYGVGQVGKEAAIAALSYMVNSLQAKWYTKDWYSISILELQNRIAHIEHTF